MLGVTSFVKGINIDRNCRTLGSFLNDVCRRTLWVKYLRKLDFNLIKPQFDTQVWFFFLILNFIIMNFPSIVLKLDGIKITQKMKSFIHPCVFFFKSGRIDNYGHTLTSYEYALSWIRSCVFSSGRLCRKRWWTLMVEVNEAKSRPATVQF